MTKDQLEKIELIKSAVKNGKKIPFKPDHDSVLYWWNIMNDVLFENELKQPVKITFRKFRNSVGWCVPFRFNNKKNRQVQIGISTSINNLYDFLCVLVHEMVHQWEWEHLASWPENVAHGKAFYSWREKIKSVTGMPLSKTYNMNIAKKLTW